MSKIDYDENSNVLKIVSEKNQPVEKKALRGFVLTVAETQEDAKAVMAGDHTKMQLAPVLATIEQEAINLVGTQGKIVLGIASYEYLIFQKELIENLSTKEGIELLSLDLFRTNQTE